MRRLFVGIGTCAIGGGLVVVFVPEAVPVVLRAALDDLNRLSAVNVGLLAAAFAVALGSRRIRFGGEHASPGDPTDRQRLPIPGSDFDDALAAEDLPVVRDRLRELATRSLARHGNSRTEAEAAVEDGTWTDDRVAAWFVGSEVPEPGLRYRLLAKIRRGTDVERRVRRTVRAIESLHGGGRDG